MTQVILIERKSAVLTPSSLACLAHVPTINLTAGSAHECRYCYARGYMTHPGEGKVAFYTNTLAKLREELPRKRKKPATVYFSPSSDLFQPIPEVLDMVYDVFEHLFRSGIGVTFITKGRIRALPTEARLEIIERLKSIACRHGLRVLVCGCKNPDITSGSCHISGRWPHASHSQLELFTLC